ncbi:hypothetical protein CICLE_v10006408mg [Citrus x clementina]|uniref:S-protein homolog n=2 Tax=Citrus TaxID=2706 RepID=V4S0H8_CITCL|nr:hypothetical protein CICLE_v10006408mg [Citrus x clementina]GAY42352.1 hypothetical protein CUMW_066190 [Citrus unshiu]
MSSPTKITLLLALLVAGMSLKSNACILFNKTYVQITNKLETGEDLTLHCKSKDDDLGEHVLHKDESYNFSFCRNVFGETLYFCSFEWSGKVHRFDIFDESRDGCDHCNWRITLSAPCRDKCYKYD